MPAESLSVAGASAGTGVALALRPPPPLSGPRPRPTLQPSGSDARCLRQAVFNGLSTGQAHCETFENRKTDESGGHVWCRIPGRVCRHGGVSTSSAAPKGWPWAFPPYARLAISQISTKLLKIKFKSQPCSEWRSRLRAQVASAFLTPL